MKFTSLLSPENQAVLGKARETYGADNQMLVSVEELCELAAVCAKYPRYIDKEKARLELRSNIIDEVADVLIVLDHITSIMGLQHDEVKGRIEAKISRVSRWLAKSDSMEQTTVDRAVRPALCLKCRDSHRPGNTYPCNECSEEGNTRTKFMPKVRCKGCIHCGKFKDIVPICIPCTEKGGIYYDDGTRPNET